MPAVKDFLAERGLKLNETKTLAQDIQQHRHILSQSGFVRPHPPAVLDNPEC